MEVFHQQSPNVRKVVLCTNIAETSLTIRGIKYVIDSGVVKRKMYDSITGMDTLKVVSISQDQAWQRTGRAGRDAAGFCYRMYSYREFKEMPMTSTPEILRSNISSTVYTSFFSFNIKIICFLILGSSINGARNQL